MQPIPIPVDWPAPRRSGHGPLSGAKTAAEDLSQRATAPSVRGADPVERPTAR